VRVVRTSNQVSMVVFIISNEVTKSWEIYNIAKTIIAVDGHISLRNHVKQSENLKQIVAVEIEREEMWSGMCICLLSKKKRGVLIPLIITD